MPRLILASTSYYRQRLLALMGLEFEVVSSDFDEYAISPEDFADKEEFVKVLAAGKVLSTVDKLQVHDDPDVVIVGGDLSVFYNHQYYPKPVNLTQAGEYMKVLGGQTHQEIAATAMWSLKTGVLSTVDTIALTLPVFTPDALETYIAKSNPLKKAGAVCLTTAKKMERHYHLQPPVKFSGSISGILGIPVQRVSELLHAADFPVPRDWEQVEAELTHDILES